jgi:hypothetical protein
MVSNKFLITAIKLTTKTKKIFIVQLLKNPLFIKLCPAFFGGMRHSARINSTRHIGLVMQDHPVTDPAKTVELFPEKPVGSKKVKLHRQKFSRDSCVD